LALVDTCDWFSRSGDPQFHTHVLVQNAAQGPDGRWTALDSDRLYAHLMAADHLYLAAERTALTERLGVRWGPVDARSGAAEIVGLDDRALIERFSKRSEQIDHWLVEQGLSGIKASSAAAVATRAPKDHSESEQSIYERWARELVEQGVGERQLAGVCHGERGRPATAQEVRQVLEELAGPEGLTEQASTFTRAEVVDALAKRLRSPRALTTRSPRPRKPPTGSSMSGRCVGRDRRLGVDRYSTPALLTLERQLVDGATQRAGERCAVVRPEIIRQVLDHHTMAGEDQAAMVRDLTQGGDGVDVVVGRAGSGKTWALGIAREAFELDGYQVHGCAPTGIVTVGLADEGFTDARTVDRLLLDLAKGRTELDARTVLVVDEAAMVATRKLAPLLAHAERAGAKVVLVGDGRQFALSPPTCSAARSATTGCCRTPTWNCSPPPPGPASARPPDPCPAASARGHRRAHRRSDGGVDRLHRRPGDHLGQAAADACFTCMSASSEPAGVAGDADRVDAVAPANLADRIGQVVADGRRGQRQPRGDLLGGDAAGGRAEHSASLGVSGVLPVSRAAATSSGSITRSPLATRRTPSASVWAGASLTMKPRTWTLSARSRWPGWLSPVSTSVRHSGSCW
jgi:AAA domain/TrwC relaxase